MTTKRASFALAVAIGLSLFCCRYAAAGHWYGTYTGGLNYHPGTTSMSGPYTVAQSLMTGPYNGNVSGNVDFTGTAIWSCAASADVFPNATGSASVHGIGYGGMVGVNWTGLPNENPHAVSIIHTWGWGAVAGTSINPLYGGSASASIGPLTLPPSPLYPTPFDDDHLIAATPQMSSSGVSGTWGLAWWLNQNCPQHNLPITSEFHLKQGSRLGGSAPHFGVDSAIAMGLDTMYWTDHWVSRDSTATPPGHWAMGPAVGFGIGQVGNPNPVDLDASNTAGGSAATMAGGMETVTISL